MQPFRAIDDFGMACSYPWKQLNRPWQTEGISSLLMVGYRILLSLL